MYLVFLFFLGDANDNVIGAAVRCFRGLSLISGIGAVSVWRSELGLGLWRSLVLHLESKRKEIVGRK